MWWGFGAGVLTFDKPFTQTGNGFFASWASFVCSILFTTETLGLTPAVGKPEVKEEDGPKMMTPTTDEAGTVPSSTSAEC